MTHVFIAFIQCLDAATQTLPVLSTTHINRLRPSSRVRKVQAGDVLFRTGDFGIPFFVLLSGRMEIMQPTLASERQITTHEPGSFPGELSMISGQQCLVIGRVTEAGEFLEMSAEGLRALIARDAELSEIIMSAFILRRLS